MYKRQTLGTAKETNNEANVEALLTGKLGDAKDTDKKETVYVEMNADGTVTKTTVSDVLKVKGKDNISDVSDLTDITNISGDEAFTTDNGKLIWENKGKDISYQGTTTKSAPIDIKVSYYLEMCIRDRNQVRQHCLTLQVIRQHCHRQKHLVSQWHILRFTLRQRAGRFLQEIGSQVEQFPAEMDIQLLLHQHGVQRNLHRVILLHLL